MVFMQPEIQFFTKEEATEYCQAEFGEPEPQEAGYYSRLQAPGYLDATDWCGPFETPEAALEHLCDLYEVDENGEDINAD